VLRQFDDLPDLAARLHRAAALVMPDLDAEEQRRLRSVLVRVDATIPVTDAYSRVLRAEKLGLLDQEYTPEQVQEVFDAYVDLIEETEAHFVTRAEFDAFVPRPPGG
jgi:hypothetical protein